MQAAVCQKTASACVAAFQGSRQWGDLYVLLLFGVLGWGMKRLGWPRPPLVLGFVLGGIVERYLFISVARYGAEWLLRPVVIIVFALALWGLCRPLFREVRAAGGPAALFSGLSRPRFDFTSLFSLGFIALLTVMLVEASAWSRDAKIVPMIVGSIAIAMTGFSLLNHTFRRQTSQGMADAARNRVAGALQLDLSADNPGLSVAVVTRRAIVFLLWLLAFLGLVALIGMLPATFAFVALYMRFEGRESWHLVLILAVGLTVFDYIVFDQLLALPWPRTVLGTWVPGLKPFLPSL